MLPSSVTELFNTSRTNYIISQTQISDRKASILQITANTLSGILDHVFGQKLTGSLDRHLQSVTLKKASDRQT